MKEVLARLTYVEAAAILQALDAYVQDGLENKELTDERGEAPDPHLAPAEAVLDRLNAARAALAEAP